MNLQAMRRTYVPSVPYQRLVVQPTIHFFEDENLRLHLNDDEIHSGINLEAALAKNYSQLVVKDDIFRSLGAKMSYHDHVSNPA